MNRENQEKLMSLCENTIDKFIATRKLLSSARTYGTLDFMGGGFVTSFIKHDKLSQVKSALEVASMYLSDLLELLDEKNISTIQLKSNSLNNFLDIFLDNFITDTLVNNTMEECNKKVNVVIDKLDEILLDLKEKYRSEFPEIDNKYTHIEDTEVVCPRCYGIHSSDAAECPYCGMLYDEENTPMLKIN